MSGPSRPSFTPALFAVFAEGYDARAFRVDAVAGLTVAIVALPLSMAIAIASGVGPDRGLFSAIVGGFLVSLLGGSRFQIGGPAGAFIVLISTTVARYGVDGLLTATLLSGVLLTVIGVLRLGTFIRYIPYPVTVGFTAGIAVTIFASQLREMLGLRLAQEPGPIVDKLIALAAAAPTANPAAIGVTALAIAVILAVRRWRPHWPGMLIAVVLCGGLVWATGLPVNTIGSAFGGIPNGLPAPRLPDLSWAMVGAVWPVAVAFALLGSIESLLSAVVADSMSGRRHDSNMELAAQGIANIGAALFGGFCVTGTIARTATNVRAGARGPVAGMLHSVFLLLFMLVAAPLARFIPLAALAGVLGVVAANMAERHQFWTLLRASAGDAVVLLATFLLVVFRDLTEGILVGFGLGTLLFMHRMAGAAEVTRPEAAAFDPALTTDRDIIVYRISGAFFFGAAGAMGAALDRIGEHPRAYVVDVSEVTVLDSTGAMAIEGVVRRAARVGATLYVAGASRTVRRVLLVHGVRPPMVRFAGSVAAAITLFRSRSVGSSLDGPSAAVSPRAP